MSRYEVVDGSESISHPFRATIIDREKDEYICECYEISDAIKITLVLNLFDEEI